MLPKDKRSYDNEGPANRVPGLFFVFFLSLNWPEVHRYPAYINPIEKPEEVRTFLARRQARTRCYPSNNGVSAVTKGNKCADQLAGRHSSEHSGVRGNVGMHEMKYYSWVRKSEKVYFAGILRPSMLLRPAMKAPSHLLLSGVLFSSFFYRIVSLGCFSAGTFLKYLARNFFFTGLVK